MSGSGTPLPPAVQSAVEELSRRGERFEVFARLGESVHLLRDASGEWESRRTREVGVACRLAGHGRTGFAAAAGSGARAGRLAALAAIEGLLPGPDPLPPRGLLGTVATPPVARPTDARQQEEFAHRLAAQFATGRDDVRVVQLRTLTGVSSTILATGEGFLASAQAGGAVVEVLLAPPAGPWRHFHFAARELADLDAEELARQAQEAALLAVRGDPPARRLADVLLAPAVAAPVVVALAQRLAREPSSPGAKPVRTRVSPAWHLVDDRPGPAGLLPLPCDGEGFPARRLELVGGGRLGERFTTWEEAQRSGTSPGGAVRPSYRHPPAAGPANLVVLAGPPLRQEELLARLEDGLYLAVPAGAVRVDHASGRFALRTAAVAIRHGRPAATYPFVDLRGSFRRLLAALVAAGDDSASFSLACAVTTPSLLFRRLEVA